MDIDQKTGTVKFPDGLTITSALTQDLFRRTPQFAAAQVQDYGTPPWIHFHLPAGEIDAKRLRVALCFNDQMLINISITVDHYLASAKNWSDYSMDIEASTKEFHDRLLQRLLGRPSKGGSYIFKCLPEGEATLRKPLQWKYPWGVVQSDHEFKAGVTSITVSYGQRSADVKKSR